MAKILIIYGAPLLRARLRTALIADGHTVFDVGDQDGGLQMLAGGGIDLVFAALDDAAINGIEVVQALHSSPRTLHIPVLMLTDSVDDEVVTKTQGAGATGLVGTGASADRVRAVVQRVLSCDPGKKAG